MISQIGRFALLPDKLVDASQMPVARTMSSYVEVPHRSDEPY